MTAEMDLSKVKLSNLRNSSFEEATKHLSSTEKKIILLNLQMEHMNGSFESLDERITHLEKCNKHIEVLLHRASDRMNDDAEVVGVLRARIAPELGQFSNDVDAALSKKRPTKD